MAEIDWRKSANSTVLRKACLNIIDALISDHYTYLNFDIKDIAETPDAPKDQIIMALVVKVAGSNRVIAANNIQQALKKKQVEGEFKEVEDSKGGNRLDIYLEGNFGVKKSGKYKGAAIKKRIVLSVKPDGRDTSGSGGGARETRRNECAQCLYADVVFNQLGRKFTSDEIKGRETELVDVDVWKAAYKNIEVDDDEKELLPTGNVLEFAWRISHMKGANALYDKLGSPTEGTYKFYRGKGIDGNKADSISAAYKRSNNDHDVKYFSSEDKWNPADIWAVHKDYPLTGKGNINEKGSNNKHLIKNYFKLNAHLIAWNNPKDGHKLVGISLKKHEGSGNSNLKVINEDKNTGWDKTIWDKVGNVSSNDWFFIKDKWDSSMDVYIKYGLGSNQDFQCRNFAGGSSPSWQLELSGGAAKQGRCGGGVAINLIKANMTKFPQSSWTALTNWAGEDSGNTSIWRKCADNSRDLHKVLDDIVTLYVKHFGNKTGVWTDDAVKNTGPAGNAARAQMRQKILDKNQSWRYSKLMGLCFIDAIASNDGMLSDTIRDLYLYASSQTAYSGIHWKLT